MFIMHVVTIENTPLSAPFCEAPPVYRSYANHTSDTGTTPDPVTAKTVNTEAVHLIANKI